MGSKHKGLQRESSIFQSLNLQRQCLWTTPCHLPPVCFISPSLSGILPVGPSKPASIFPDFLVLPCLSILWCVPV